MKIIHTADLHIGQTIYQHYDRSDEHRHFFNQLEQWCRQERPDALVVSGDIFDIQQPGASVKQEFVQYFVQLHQACPDMHIIVTAGNHDSAMRLQADSAIWTYANTHLVGTAPARSMITGSQDNTWQQQYIIDIGTAYVIALPYMAANCGEALQCLLQTVQQNNLSNKPVVVMAHMAVTGCDMQGHNIELGTLVTQALDSLPQGYDYLALGHIHKPQTINHPQDSMVLNDTVTYPAGVARYSGSALHVSCDEAYPHTVTVVEIDHHGGDVNIRQLRINELRHFHLLPQQGYFTDANEAIEAIKQFAENNSDAYLRLHFHYNTNVPTDFNTRVYDLLESYNRNLRYNPKHLWHGAPAINVANDDNTIFEIADLQQMTNPLEFITTTIDQYPGIDLDMITSAFKEIEEEVRHINDDEKKKKLNTKNTNPLNTQS
ncbi:MAG: exonuclease SbcCD subunit D, partial [Muribaculaceae bacterium]